MAGCALRGPGSEGDLGGEAEEAVLLPLSLRWRRGRRQLRRWGALRSAKERYEVGREVRFWNWVVKGITPA